jgi:Ni/Fe-hydrogenase subunit HybB-like protein
MIVAVAKHGLLTIGSDWGRQVDLVNFERSRVFQLISIAAWNANSPIFA